MTSGGRGYWGVVLRVIGKIIGYQAATFITNMVRQCYETRLGVGRLHRGHHGMLDSLPEHYCMLDGFPGHYCMLDSFPVHYCMLDGFPGHYCMLDGFPGHYSVMSDTIWTRMALDDERILGKIMCHEATIFIANMCHQVYRIRFEASFGYTYRFCSANTISSSEYCQEHP